MQTQTINLSIPKSLLMMINKQAKAEARTKSGMIQQAIRMYINRKKVDELFAYGIRKVNELEKRLDLLEKRINKYSNPRTTYKETPRR